MGNLHDPGLEGEGDGGAAWGQLDFHQAPDAIAQLEGLVDHVLSLQGSLGNSKSLNKISNKLPPNLAISSFKLTLFCPILVEIPSLVHSTFSIVYWISLAAGMSFQVFRKVFFSIAPTKRKMQSKLKYYIGTNHPQ